jgi:hypothetical protein
MQDIGLAEVSQGVRKSFHNRDRRICRTDRRSGLRLTADPPRAAANWRSGPARDSCTAASRWLFDDGLLGISHQCRKAFMRRNGWGPSQPP